MEAKYIWMNSLLTENREAFSLFPEIKWLNPYAADDYLALRSGLLKELRNVPLFKETKPYHSHISKGCQICGSGKWSCLFITNKCNANCFYCPAPQDNDEVPSTQGLDFDRADDYADYINNFGFDGVAFSGGEPLLYFDRTLEYLTILRTKCKPELYIWMYTNGILASEEKFEALVKAGINEVRFDIGATNFSLENVKKAKGIIPVVTIEIPAVPEEKDAIIAMLGDMIEAGVTNINLHHMRLTKHNVTKLSNRDYNIISAERPLVIESELAALQIIKAAEDLGLSIGVNYCSFHYKNRFQKAGYRKIIAEKVVEESCITENGFIREYDGNSIAYKTIKLFNKPSISCDDTNIDIDGVSYSYTMVNMFADENITAYKTAIDELLQNEPEHPPADPVLFAIWQFEYIERGLRDF